MTTNNIADLVRSAAVNFPDKPALISKNDTYTWAQFDRAADTGAAVLIKRGLQPGGRLLVQLPTSTALALALIAGARAGLVLVPVDPTRTDADRIAARVQAALIISDQQGGQLNSADVSRWWDSTDEPTLPEIGGEDIGGEDIAILGRASRTDQAVMLSHRAVLAAVAMIGETTNLKLRPDDRVVLVLPLFHLAGFVTAFLPLTLVGGAAVIPDVPEVTGPNVSGTGVWRQYVSGILDAIHDHHVTVLPGAPGLYRLLLKSDSLERSLSSIRLMTSGASPLNPKDFSAMRSRTGSPVWEGYGISEAASVVTSSLMTGGARARSVGLPLPGIELRIASADSAVLGTEEPDDDLLADFDDDNEPGRISIRGANLFSGYWPDGSGGPDADGWFATADVGYLDNSGELHLIDRASETVTVAGFTVYPREVEAALLTHPYVRDVAVIGLPGRAGQELVAIIVANRGTTPTESDLTEHLAELLPVFKRPTTYHLTPILPRTELGRLDRDTVRAQYAAAAGLDLEVPTEVDQKLTVVATEPDPAPAVEPDSNDSAEAEPEPEPEVMDVAQLDQLGSRLPGVQGRSRRSTYDTDDDLFGEDVFGEDLLAAKLPDPTEPPSNPAESEPNGAIDSESVSRSDEHSETSK